LFKIEGVRQREQLPPRDVGRDPSRVHARHVQGYVSCALAAKAVATAAQQLVQLLRSRPQQPQSDSRTMAAIEGVSPQTIGNRDWMN